MMGVVAPPQGVSMRLAQPIRCFVLYSQKMRCPAAFGVGGKEGERREESKRIRVQSMEEG